MPHKSGKTDYKSTSGHKRPKKRGKFRMTADGKMKVK